MKTLTEGKKTKKEIAEWFGVTQATFSKYKEKKLKELEKFAEFYEEKSKIIITKVLCPVYAKQGSNAYTKIKEEVDKTWRKNGLDSCKRVSMEIENKLKNELTVTSNTIYDYTRQSRNELYGIPFVERGKIGSCTYLWVKKIGDGITTVYEPLTAEEEKIKQELIKKYFGNADEKQIIVQGMVAKGEITKEQAWDVLTELTNMKGENFYEFLVELQEKVGCQVVRGTMVERDIKHIEGGFVIVDNE